MKLSVGYPTLGEEVQIVKNMLSGISAANVSKIISAGDVEDLKKDVEKVVIQDSLIEYAAECIDKTREHDRISLGASPRALIAWIKAAKAYAFVEGRNFVKPDDLKLLAEPVLAHRLILVQNTVKDAIGAGEIIQYILRKVRVPLGK